MEIKTIAHSLFTDFDVSLFQAGKHFKLYEKFGAHPTTVDGQKGVYFAVYSPAATNIQVVGSFNDWDGDEHSLFVRWDSSGIWEGFIPGAKEGDMYKFKIFSSKDTRVRVKADPYAFKTELMPLSASIIWSSKYKWKDKKWTTKERSLRNSHGAPQSIYEVHLGSWKKDGGHSLSYKQLADELVSYVKEMGFTHVEMMPITEHPYYPSWGYLSTSYFAPTSRFGNPDELKILIDAFHKANIGVIVDWVPAHFPNDDFALADFDGSCVYEHFDRQKGFHPDWNSLIFNFERNEIRSFLISSAFYWFEQFHFDGLRVDAVSSMLYLDYSREEGQWSPNIYGGNEYLAAKEFLRDLNLAIYGNFPDVQMIAEESTAFPGVTKPTHTGGLGFGKKWMMGWMNDTLAYFSRDPIYRMYHHNEISFSLTYAFTENFLLPLSHDEVVHGKGSIISRMPGDDWQQFANLRLLYSYMFTHPGDKLLFMGNELGQRSEWNFNESLEWVALDHLPHKGIQTLVKDLNNLYTSEVALHKNSFSPEGFDWISYDDHENSVLAYARKGDDDTIIAICNFTPNIIADYRIGVPEKGKYKVLMNTDDVKYGGSGSSKKRVYNSKAKESHGKKNSLDITLAPLGTLILKKVSKK
jgi:1,4-alpha-glucan branching enzyme